MGPPPLHLRALRPRPSQVLSESSHVLGFVEFTGFGFSATTPSYPKRNHPSRAYTRLVHRVWGVGPPWSLFWPAGLRSLNPTPGITWWAQYSYNALLGQIKRDDSGKLFGNIPTPRKSRFRLLRAAVRRLQGQDISGMGLGNPRISSSAELHRYPDPREDPKSRSWGFL